MTSGDNSTPTGAKRIIPQLEPSQEEGVGEKGTIARLDFAHIDGLAIRTDGYTANRDDEGDFQVYGI